MSYSEEKNVQYASLGLPLTDVGEGRERTLSTITMDDVEKKGDLLTNWKQIVDQVKQQTLGSGVFRNIMRKKSFISKKSFTSNRLIRSSLKEMIERKSLYANVVSNHEIHCTDIKNNLLVVGCEEGTLELYEFKGLELKFLQELGEKDSEDPLNEKHKNFIDSVSFDSEGKLVVSGSHDGTVKIWGFDESSGCFKGLAVLEGHTGKVISISITKDKEVILSSSNDKTTLVWRRKDVGDWKKYVYEISQRLEEKGYINSITISKDKRFIAGGLEDGDIAIYELKDGKYVDFQRLAEHQDQVNSVSFSTFNGGTLITGSSDGSIKLWQIQSGKFVSVNTLYKPGTQVISVSVSSDGRIVVGGYDDKAVRIWKSDSDSNGHFKKYKSLKNHKNYLTSICISSDDKYILSGSADKTAKLWKVEDNEIQGRNLQILGECEIDCQCLHFSDDKQMIFAAGNFFSSTGVTNNQNSIMIWRSKTIKELTKYQPYQKLKGHQDKITSLKVLPNRRRLISGSEDKTAIIWTLQNEDELFTGNAYVKTQTFQTHYGPIIAVELYGDEGEFALTASTDKTIKIWAYNQIEYDNTFTIQVNNWRVCSLNIVNQGRALVTGSLEKTIKIWNLNPENLKPLENTEPIFVNEHDDPIREIQFYDNQKKMLSCCSNGKLIAFEQTEKNGLVSYQVKKRADFNCSMIRVIEGLNILLAIDKVSKRINILDLQSLEKINDIKGHGTSVKAFDISSDGSSLCSFSCNQSLKIWSLRKTGTQMPKITLNQTINSKAKYSKMNCVSICEGDNHIAVGMKDHTTRVYYRNFNGFYAGEQIIGFGKSSICCVKISRDGKYLVIGNLCGKLSLWKFNNKLGIFCFVEGLQEKRYQNTVVNCLDISDVFQGQKARFVVAGFSKDVLLVWRIKDTEGIISTERLKTLRQNSHAGSVYSVTLSQSTLGHKAPILVSGSADKSIKVWRYAQGVEDMTDGFVVKQSIVSDDGYVYSVSLSPDNKYLVAGSEDRTTTVWTLNWRTKMYEETLSIEETSSYSYIWQSKISKDCSKIVSSRGDGVIKFWKKSSDCYQKYIEIQKGKYYDLPSDFSSIVTLDKGDNKVLVRRLAPNFGLPNSYFFLKKVEEIFSTSIYMNKNGLFRMAKYLKDLKDESSDFFDVDYLVHSRINIILIGVLSGYKGFLQKCLEWFGYIPALYKKGYDPLEIAFIQNSKPILDAFTDYLKTGFYSTSWNPLYGDDKELFYQALRCNSSKMHKYVLTHILVRELKEDIDLPEMFPLGEKDYIAIESDKFTKDKKFLKRVFERAHLAYEKREKEVTFKASVFPIDLNINSRFCTELLSFVGDSKDLVYVYETDFKYLVKEMWKKNVWLFWIYAIISWATTIFFNFALVFKRDKPLFSVIVTVLCLLNLTFEIKIATVDVKKYFSKFYNYVDLLLNINLPLILFLTNFIDDFETHNLSNFYSTLFILISTARSCSHLRVIDSFRYQVAMIIEVFKNMKGFIILLVISIFMLTVAKIHVDKTAGENIHTFKDLLKQGDLMYNLFQDDWEGSDEYNANQYIQFLINTIFLPLVIHEFLISIIVNTFDRYEEIRDFADYRETVNLLVDMNYFSQWTSGEEKARDIDEKYFHLVSSNDEGHGHEHAMHRIEKKLKKIEKMIK